MKSVLIGICLMGVISCVAWLVMDNQRMSSGDAFVSQNNSVRLDN